MQELLTTYELNEGTNCKKLLQNTGEAKLDLTAIYYNGRSLVDKAAIFKDREISKFIAFIVDEAESIRRYLMNPSLQIDRLRTGVHNLYSSFGSLRDELSRTEFM